MPPKHWLVKSEPDVYSIDDLARDKRTFWNGVRNHRARNIMRDEMKVGDAVFFYHSNADPSAIVGIARVASEPRPDPTQFDRKAGEDGGYDPKSKPESPTWWAVDVEFVEKLRRPVSLAEVKATPALKDMRLVKLARLSVQPVTAAEWRTVVALAGGKRHVSASTGGSVPPDPPLHAKDRRTRRTRRTTRDFDPAR